MAKKAQPRNRGQIIPKGDGKWLVRFYRGRDERGKRTYNSELVRGTFKQAEKALTRLLGSADTGTYVPPSKLTVKEHCDAWLSTKVSLGPKTLMTYRDRLVKDVYPGLGQRTLASLSGPVIQTWCASLTSRGLSPRTVEYSHTVLSQAMKYAVRHGLLLRNPCEFTELPRKAHAEQQVFTPREASLFIEHTKTSKWNPLWTLMLTTGMRPQEALALQWTDIDLTNRVVMVRRAMVEVELRKYEPRETKTKKSRRALSIPEYTVQALQKHQFQAGGIGATWVFTNRNGHHYGTPDARKAWHRDIILANANLAEAGLEERIPDITLYGARHSGLTYALMVPGGNLKVASERAGHSTINTTGDIYSHVLPEVDREIGDKIGVLLFTQRTGT